MCVGKFVQNVTQELMGLKTDATWKPDASGIVREVQVKESITADTSSDLKLEKALSAAGVSHSTKPG